MYEADLAAASSATKRLPQKPSAAKEGAEKLSTATVIRWWAPRAAVALYFLLFIGVVASMSGAPEQSHASVERDVNSASDRRAPTPMSSGIRRHSSERTRDQQSAISRSEPRSEEERSESGAPNRRSEVASATSMEEPTSSSAGEQSLPVDLTRSYLSSVSSSSVLQPRRHGSRYAASKAADGDVNTAWGAARGQFVDQWLEIRFSRPVTVTRIEVKTGFCKFFRGQDLFKANRRLKRVKIDIGSWSTAHRFADSSQWQNVSAGSNAEGRSLRLTVLEIYEGNRWEDLHVSEIRVWGTPTD
jgi:hypothetical protein